MPSYHPMNAPDEDETPVLDSQEADEIIEDDGDGDLIMSSDEDEHADEVIPLQNDSAAHFDSHHDSIFCIAQHPTKPNLIATGGGDDVAYIFDSTPEPPPVLPQSYEADPQPKERSALQPVARLQGHEDSVNAITFTLPHGDYLVTAGLDGRLIAWHHPGSQNFTWEIIGSAREVEEINWVMSCPSSNRPNCVAIGASDGSVWVYGIAASPDAPLNILQAYYLHSSSSTAGAWTPDGNLLCTVAEDGSFYVWDPWDQASQAGLMNQAGQALVALTAEDERFNVQGGLYSIAISPGGTLAAVGGANGTIRVIGLPRISKNLAQPTSSTGQIGQILASLQAQSDSIESLCFSQPPITLLAAASVDGSIVLFDVAHRYAVRRKIDSAHEDEAVIKLEFDTSTTQASQAWMLTSCGNDGVIRRWDTRGGTAAAANGLVREFRGHRGGGDGGGILGFVQSPETGRIVTAGDE